MRILALAPILPDAPSDGDRLRIFHFLRELGKRHDITLAAFEDRAQAADPRLLSGFVRAIHSIPVASPLRWLKAGLLYGSALPANVNAYRSQQMARLVDGLLAQAKAEGRPYDLVYCYRLRMAPYALRARTRRVIDFTDSLTRYFERRAASAQGIRRWVFRREAEKIAAYEAWVAGQFDACFMNSTEDAAVLRAMAPHANVAVAANGADLEHLKPAGKGTGRDRNLMLFAGNLAYEPNVQALLWFHAQVMPLILKRSPDARLQVLGGGSSSALDGLRADARIEFTGFVRDMNPLLNQAGVVVCPVRLGAGRQNKVLDAFATATPVVATGLAARGVEARDGRELLAADNAEDFAAAVLKVMANASLARRLGQAGLTFCRSRYRWSAAAGILERNL